MDLPLIVYNIPGRTGKNIETETLVRMTAHPNVVVGKEASGSVPQMMDVIRAVPEDFDVLSGDDNLALALTLLGGRGVISVASNLVPSEVSRMISSALAGTVGQAREEYYRPGACSRSTGSGSSLQLLYIDRSK